MGDWKPLKKTRDASNIIQHCQSPENSFKKTHLRLQDSPRQAHLHTPAAAQGLDWLTKPGTSGTDGKLRPPWKSLFYGCACGDPSRNWQLEKMMSGHVGGSPDHCAGSSDKFWPRLKDNPSSVGRVILTSQWPSKPSLAPSSNPMDFNSATTCIAIKSCILGDSKVLSSYHPLSCHVNLASCCWRSIWIDGSASGIQ